MHALLQLGVPGLAACNHQCLCTFFLLKKQSVFGTGAVIITAMLKACPRACPRASQTHD